MNNFDDSFFPTKPVIRDVNAEDFLRKSNIKKSNENKNKYINFGNYTAGRGFGNLDNNNFVHFGKNSRDDNKKFNNNLEEDVNYRFDYLFDNKKQMAFASDNHIIKGSSTRKQHLNSESVFNHNSIDMNELKKPNPFNNAFLEKPVSCNKEDLKSSILEKPVSCNNSKPKKKKLVKKVVNKQLKKEFTFNY